MPYPGGKHGPGHYVGAGGVIPPPVVADPVGTLLAFHNLAGGISRMYSTGDGSTFGFVSLGGNVIASDIGRFSSVADNSPPSVPTELNYTSIDGTTWIDQSANPASPWNIAVAPSFSGEVFLRAAGLFAIFLPLLAVGNYMTSPDGIVWTLRTGPWGASVPDLYSYMSDGATDFLALGGSLWGSVDGIAWVQLEPAFTGGRLVFAGSNGGDKYWSFGGTAGGARVESSLTGAAATWARDLVAEANLDAAGLLAFNNPISVAYSNSIGGGTFVLNFDSGATVGSSTTRLATSLDGINWTNPGNTLNGNFVRYSGTLSQFVRTIGNATDGRLLRSGNGNTWTANVINAFSASILFPSADFLTSF